MADDEALHILTAYIKGCGGELCAEWHAEEIWDFKHADGKKGENKYKNRSQVAVAMGLQPNKGLAARVTKTARAERSTKQASLGAKTSSLGLQDTDVCRKRRNDLDGGLVDDIVAASGPTKVCKHGAIQAAPSHAAQAYKRVPARERSPMPMPRLQLGMRDSRSSPGVQTYVAVAEEPNLAAHAAFASGTKEGFDGHHFKEEMETLQHENTELKQLVAKLQLQVKHEQSEHRAREEDMRKQQRANDQIINAFTKLRELEAANRK
ncbi:hypothetical protein COCOBI_14-4450 [Coccomyxa sp. Obi]|nr:hypothetical protein COCOBI_14-4450 [Coccomyxa sp. Obi]